VPVLGSSVLWMRFAPYILARWRLSPLARSKPGLMGQKPKVLSHPQNRAAFGPANVSGGGHETCNSPGGATTFGSDLRKGR
jgi:hypothetical protein